MPGVRRRLCCLAFILLFAIAPTVRAKDVEQLAIGALAPELNLPGVDGKTYSLKDFTKGKLLVVIFTCNHCPTAHAYEQRIVQLYKDYHGKGVAFVAISPNDPKAVQLDELGYSDIGDSFEDMKIYAQRCGFEFPYLYDGDTQRVATAYGALVTPHIFIFDAERKLRFNGRIDDGEMHPPRSHDTRNALDALLAGREVAVTNTRVFGCSTKWADKQNLVNTSLEKWNAEPVELKEIDAAGLKDLAANKTKNYRLINLWSTTCVPCIAEMPEFVTLNRMFRGRHFEMFTITTDPPDRKEMALDFLKKAHVSSTNYIFNSDDRDKLAEALDPKWEGPVPYTILVAPGGEVIKRWKDVIELQEVRSELSQLLGRTYADRK